MDSFDSTIQLRLVMYGVVNNAICLLGLSGNFLLLYIFILYKDMRKQSINIYLTVLALYDNGVLIFSILMLNLPAITDYQQVALANSAMANRSLHQTTPIFTSSFPASQATYLASSPAIYQATAPVFGYGTFSVGSTITTKTPFDTGQNGSTTRKQFSTSQHSWPHFGSTHVTSFSPTASPLDTTIAPVTPATVLTSKPFSSRSQSGSTSFSSTATFFHPLRHQSTSAAPSSHHRSKRTKRHLNTDPSTHAAQLFTHPIRNIFHECFNLTSDDLSKLKHNMVLLNNTDSFEPKTVDQTTEPLDLVDRLFFEALLRQLILWIRLSLHTTLIMSKSTSAPLAGAEKAFTADDNQYPSAITDLVKCRRSLVQYYQSQVPQSDQSGNSTEELESYAIADQQSEVRMPEFNPLLGVTEGEPDAPPSSLRSQLSDDEATSVNLLLLNTLEDIYQSRSLETVSTVYPANQYYADSLTGEGNTVDMNESSSISANAFDVDSEPDVEADYQPPPGNLYPLMYYVKVVYPLALISQTGSIWTTCLITIERYLAVCHPLMSLTLSTRSRAIWALCILSAAAFLFNLPRFAEVDTTGDSIRPSDLRKNKIYYHVYYICLNLSLNYILPLSLLSALNIKIYSSVRQANAHRNELTRARQSELHLASMLVLIVAIFIACNAPAFLVNCMEPYFDVGNPLLEAITIFSNVLVCFNSAINFVIYCIFGKKFRSKLKQVLGLRGSICLMRNGSARNQNGRNRYFSQRFSTQTRNSSFKLTLATHLQNANGPTNGNHIHQNSQTRQYSYPHTALPAVVADTLNSCSPNGHDALKNSDECTKPRSASACLNLIPLNNLQLNGDTRGTNGNHYRSQNQPSNHFYGADTTVALNTFV